MIWRRGDTVNNLNSKYEILNSKQARISEIQMTQTKLFLILIFGFRICFELVRNGRFARDSDFAF